MRGYFWKKMLPNYIRESITYGAGTPVFLICFSCIFCCLRFTPIWHAVSKSISASSSIGLIHKPHKSPNSFFQCPGPVSYTHLRAHETRHDLVCRLLLEKKKNN